MESAPLRRQPTADVPTIALRSPADLIAITPYLLGFHPAESVVVSAFRGDRVVFAARSDLPGPDTAPAHQLASELVEVTARQRPDGLAILGYGPAAEVDALLRPVWEVAGRHELPVREVLRVQDGRWWSYLCENAACCPPEGTPFDPAASEVSARCVMEGLAAAASREELAQRVAPLDGAARDAMARATDRAEQELRRWLAALPEQQWLTAISDRGQAAVAAAIKRYEADGRLDDDELAWLSLLLVSIPVRDAAWRAIEEVRPHLRLWTDATRRVNPELVPAPASLLGFTAWRAGEATLARLALERALAADPSYSMARLLLEGVQRGVPPSVLDGWGSPQWSERVDCEPPASQPEGGPPAGQPDDGQSEAQPEGGPSEAQPGVARARRVRARKARQARRRG